MGHSSANRRVLGPILEKGGIGVVLAALAYLVWLGFGGAQDASHRHFMTVTTEADAERVSPLVRSLAVDIADTCHTDGGCLNRSLRDLQDLTLTQGLTETQVRQLREGTRAELVALVGVAACEGAVLDDPETTPDCRTSGQR
jgi:hypothetical protein